MTPAVVKIDFAGQNTVRENMPGWLRRRLQRRAPTTSEAQAALTQRFERTYCYVDQGRMFGIRNTLDGFEVWDLRPATSTHVSSHKRFVQALEIVSLRFVRASSVTCPCPDSRSGRWLRVRVGFDLLERSRLAATRTPGQSKAVSSEDPIGQVCQTAKTGPPRRSHQPAESDGRVGPPKDLHTCNHGSVRKHAVDSRHHLPGLETVGSGVERGLGDVFELDPAAPTITPLEELDLPSAEGTVAIVKESDSPRLVHAKSPLGPHLIPTLCSRRFQRAQAFFESCLGSRAILCFNLDDLENISIYYIYKN